LSSSDITGKNRDQTLSLYLVSDSVRRNLNIVPSTALPLKQNLRAAVEFSASSKNDPEAVEDGQKIPIVRGRDPNRIYHHVSDLVTGIPDQHSQATWELPTVRRLLEPFGSEFADMYYFRLNPEPKIV